MSGLGIVLEEAENRPAEAFGEPLLPPLPKGEPFLRLILTSYVSLNDLPASSSHNHSHLALTDDGLGDFLLNGLYASYELDLPSLRIDAMPSSSQANSCCPARCRLCPPRWGCCRCADSSR